MRSPLVLKVKFSDGLEKGEGVLWCSLACHFCQKNKNDKLVIILKLCYGAHYVKYGAHLEFLFFPIPVSRNEITRINF